MSLRDMLLGPPLHSDVGGEQVAQAVNRHLEALARLLPLVYSESGATRQAVVELQQVIQMDASRDCLACKRAMLLFAIASEKAAVAYWQSRGERSAAMARDLHTRVLPFLVPRFLNNSAQAPVAFVHSALVLHEMWAGETLGNHGGAGTATHHNSSTGDLEDRKDGELTAAAASRVH